MKRNLFFLGSLALLTLIACSKENSGNTNTRLRIHLTDAPFDASEVNVDIQQVRVNMSDDSTGWIDLATNAGIYNLLDYQNGADTVIADTLVPTGTVKEIRFVLGNQNSIVIDSVSYPLTIPSGGSSGLKLKLNKKLNANLDSLVIDFDAALSIHQTGKGDYKLQPVLKIQ
jgi:hypothetical protein